jgi:hypothetical protein
LIGNIESTQQEHTQLLRALEHRSELTGTEVTTIKEEIKRLNKKASGFLIPETIKDNPFTVR